MRSLANAIKQLGFEFKWVEKPEDIEKADVRPEKPYSPSSHEPDWVNSYTVS